MRGTRQNKSKTNITTMLQVDIYTMLFFFCILSCIRLNKTRLTFGTDRERLLETYGKTTFSIVLLDKVNTSLHDIFFEFTIFRFSSHLQHFTALTLMTTNQKRERFSLTNTEVGNLDKEKQNVFVMFQTFAYM